MTSTPKEPGYLIGFVSIAFLVVFLVAILNQDFQSFEIKKGMGSVLLGLYLMLWGLMFLVSYYFSHKSFFFRALIWICNNFSYPASPKMAFFYSSIAFILGVTTLLKGLGVF